MEDTPRPWTGKTGYMVRDGKIVEWRCDKCPVHIGSNLWGDTPFAMVKEHIGSHRNDC